jgi:hypothetical protein
MEWYNRQMTRDGLVPGGVGSQVYEAADQGLIPAEVAPEMIRAFLRAGMDSTIGSISGALRYLAMDPKQWDALLADPGKARAAFDEATRLESPVSISYRKTSGDAELSGYAVPAGSKVRSSSRRWRDAIRESSSMASRRTRRPMRCMPSGVFR